MLICHALPDRDIARLLENLLEAAGLAATLGPRMIGDAAYSPADDDSSATTEVAIVIVGADTSSHFFRAEVARLAARAAAEAEFRLLPLILPGATPDDLPALSGFQAVDLRLDGGMAEIVGGLAAAVPMLGAVFLQAARRRPDLVGGLLAGLARRWQAVLRDDRADRLFELAAGLLERAEPPHDDAEPSRKGGQGLLATIAAFGLDLLDAAANAPEAEPEAAPTDADTTTTRKALAARLGAWAAEMLERGKLAGARRAYEQVLALAKNTFGDDSRTTLDIAAGLARSLRGLGELEQAQAIEEDTLARLRIRVGDDDAATLAAAGNLAATLAARGFLAEARELQESVLLTRRRVLGDAHPETLMAMGNLAGTLHAQGHYAGARALREEALDSWRALFGADYPETLAAAWNLLATCLAMGDTAAATELVETELAPLFAADATSLPADLTRIRAGLADLARAPSDLAAGGQALGGRRMIFISYRGDDRPYAARIYDHLARRFGGENVFFDRGRDDIPVGGNFPAVLDRALHDAEIVLGIVGPGWVAPLNQSRLAGTNDFVRHELVTAIRRRANGEPLTVMPLTVGGVGMPGSLPPESPTELADFLHIQAKTIRDDPHFEDDFLALADFVDRRCPGLRARQLNARLRGILASREQSQAALGQDIAVREVGRSYVRRSAASAALNDWWNAWPKDHRAFVLLGEEGDGKSWAVADWLAERVVDEGFAVPVVVAPAHRLTHATVSGILAQVLGDFQPSATERWYRLICDIANESDAELPRFILVVDALNEHPRLRWQDLFDTQRSAPWRQHVALICLCRSEYWRRLAIPRDDLPLPWRIDPFDDAELDRALAQRNATRSEFGVELLQWMSRPRYFNLAFRLRDTLAEGALTLERLIYEDWRDMLARKQGRPCSHNDLLCLIVGLAERHEQRRFASADFSRQAEGITGDVADLRLHLVSAGIIDERNGRMQISQRHLALALGMVLANIVEDHQDCTPAELAELIATYIDSCPESDLQVRICAMATFHALNTTDFPEAGRLALLRAWIDGRNLDDADLEKIAAYLPLQPHAYLRMAEVIWSETSNREAQDAFMAGFLQHRHIEAVAVEMKQTFRRWLGFVHPNGYTAWFGPDEARLAVGRQEVERRLGHTPTPGPARVLGIDLEIIEDAGMLRLAQVALAVISHDRGHGYAEELCVGLVAATVMDGSQGEFSWVLRTARAQTSDELISAAKDFLEEGRKGNTIGYLAARKLLMNLGNEDARRQLDEIPEEFRFVHPLVAMHQENPCDSHGWLWTEDNYLDCLERSHKHGSVIARQMKEVALNPESTLPAVYSSRLNEAGDGLDLARVACQMGNTIENHQFEEIEPALCAFAVLRYRNLIVALANQMVDRNNLARRMLAYHLLDHFPVLGAAELHVLLAAWQSTLAGESEHDRIAQMMLFPIVVFDVPAAEQFRRLRERGDATGYVGRHGPCFQSLNEEIVPEILDALQSIEPSAQMRLSNLLWYLSRTLRQPRAEIRNILLARFAEFDTIARAYCMEIAINAADGEAARRIIDTGWSRRLGRDHAFENDRGSILLAEYGQGILFNDLVGRIGAEWLGYAVKHRGYLPDEMERYAQVVDQTWRGIVARIPPPEILSLSSYVRLTVTDDGDRGEDQLGASDNDPTGVRFANNTWGGSAGTSSFEDLQRAFDTDGRIDRLNTLSRQIADIGEDERSRGNPWFGSSFRHGELDRLLALESTPWREWIGPVLRDDDNARRLLILCRGFYEKLCAALMTHSPHEGLALFEVLVSNRNYRIVDGNLELPFLFLDVFAAPDSPEVEHILREQIADATNDFELFEFALLCGHGGRANWMHQLVAEWLASDDDYDQARGLILLGFSNQPVDGERLTDWIANNDDCWLRDLADVASRRYRRNASAQIWFERFLERTDRSEAWADFRLFLRCVDRRFWLWLDRTQLEQADAWKRDAISMSFDTIRSACNNNEKAWKDEFIGQKIKSDELWPWMSRYETP